MAGSTRRRRQLSDPWRRRRGVVRTTSKADSCFFLCVCALLVLAHPFTAVARESAMYFVHSDHLGTP